jgi:hypothetical protein
LNAADFEPTVNSLILNPLMVNIASHEDLTSGQQGQQASRAPLEINAIRAIRRFGSGREFDISPNRAYSQISFPVSGFRDDVSSERQWWSL